MNASITLTRNAVRRSKESATHIGTVASGIQNSGSAVKRRSAFATTTSSVIAGEEAELHPQEARPRVAEATQVGRGEVEEGEEDGEDRRQPRRAPVATARLEGERHAVGLELLVEERAARDDDAGVAVGDPRPRRLDDDRGVGDAQGDGGAFAEPRCPLLDEGVGALDDVTGAPRRPGSSRARPPPPLGPSCVASDAVCLYSEGRSAQLMRETRGHWRRDASARARTEQAEEAPGRAQG